ncbi:hypothetical protein [Xanthomonas campestris]|uniref:hypothetical protein n=1 Tax=Xanthomonas campestris TaxID=339 RepID=UPI000E1EA679|nr:hypothetical protein [Xanthomonas campestris]
MERKFFTEIAFNLHTKNTLLIHAKDIGHIEKQSQEILDIANDCHIYLIVKRPRLSFVPDSLTWENGVTKGSLSCRVAGRDQPILFSMVGEPLYKISYAPYPHRTIDLIDEQGLRVLTLPAHFIPRVADWTDSPWIHECEVVYVGMAYGDGNRSAKDRLEGHSTLQQVLADMNSDEPDSEALIVMVQYQPPMAMIHFNGADKSLDPDNDRDAMEDIRQIEEKISPKMEIALAEAALIRYFQPHYNEKYKNNFPDKKHVVTESLYEIDLLGLSVEINTEDLRIRLFSKTRGAGAHHIASFDLHDPNLRLSFFSPYSTSLQTAEHFSGPVF